MVAAAVPRCTHWHSITGTPSRHFLARLTIFSSRLCCLPHRHWQALATSPPHQTACPCAYPYPFPLQLTPHVLQLHLQWQLPPRSQHRVELLLPNSLYSPCGRHHHLHFSSCRPCAAWRNLQLRPHHFQRPPINPDPVIYHSQYQPQCQSR